MEKKDILLLAAGILTGLLLLIFSRTEKYRKRPKLRVIFLIPLAMAVFHIEKTGFQTALLGIYIGCAGLAFMVLTDKRKTAVFTGCSVLMLTAPLLCPMDIRYRRESYSDDFKECFRCMKRDYVLTEHKGIDWDSLYDKYLPMFQEADKSGDVGMCYEVGRQFAMEFHDGHVNFSYGDVDESKIHEERYDRSHCGYDYGFALLRNSSGKVVFVNVDSESDAYGAGIRDGLEIISVDGEDINKVIEQGYVWFSNFPDKENEAFYAPLAALSGKEGTVNVGFRDEKGIEHSADIDSSGSFYERFNDTIDKLDSKASTDTRNLYCYMLDDNTGCVIMNGMDMDDNIPASMEAEMWFDSMHPDDPDIDEFKKEIFSDVKIQMCFEINKLKEQGAENLIIDLRNNSGGQVKLTTTLLSLFTGEELFVEHEGELCEDGYRIVDKCTVVPDNKWGDGKIVILVNNNSASAAELFTVALSQLDNVTVMGFTKMYGCAQATSPYHGGKMVITSSVMLSLDENGEVLIDSGTDRLNRYVPDMIIPLDDEVIKSIFTDNSDYLLDYANKYIDRK